MKATLTGRLVTLPLTAALAFSPVAHTLAAAQAKPAAAKPAAPAAAEPRWPRAYLTPNKGQIVVYEPQISSWANQRQVVAYAAASYQVPGATASMKPTMGTIRIEAQTRVSLDTRLVNFANMKIAEANFPGLQKQSLQEVVSEITKAIPEADRTVDLDTVLAFVDKSTIKPKDVPGLKADPPKMFFSKTPAILVNVDGEPIWSPIKQNDLKFLVNTNWDLFLHEPTKTYYLRNNQNWLSAASLTGPWNVVSKLPPSFSSLPADDNFKDVKANVPGKSLSEKQKPQVFVSQEPAELILLTGEPNYVAVSGTNLLWVQNTESDVFRMGRTGTVYYLVSGRWFSAPDFTGPWTFASTKLPEDFKKIPLEHERSRVLASVPGTDQAIEGVLLAQVPQTARVNKKELQAPPVGYNGAPEFKPIEGTNPQVQRAVNTDKDIILADKNYYYCYQGVWFVSQNPDGPFVVATTIPQSIYTIPASSPAHNVTYVTVEDDDDSDEWVTFAMVAGYTGLMIGWGCAVWGSGWYYPPYAYGGIYYPHYPTYGYGARYNPWTGSYGRGAVAYGPYGGAGVGARYNPRTGTYSRGAAAYGPYGAAGAASAYNPRTGAVGATRQGSNVYGSWGSTAVQRGDDWAQTNRVTNRATGTTTRTTRTDEGSAITRNGPGAGNNSGVVRTDNGDVYAGRDGNVYKKNGDTWQKNEGGNWSNAGAGDRATTQQLDKDRAARSSGAERTKTYNSTPRSGAGSGSYRGGGASRGGGGRRR